MTVLWDLREELRMCVDVACVRASEVCWFGFEGGLFEGCLGFGFGGEWSVCVIMWFCRF